MTVAGAGVPAPRLSGTLWLTPLGSKGGWGGGLVSFDDHTWGRLADGSVTIRCVLQASIGDQAKGVSQPIWGGQLVQELVVNVVPRNEQVVRLVTPVGVRQELLRALSVMPLRPQRQDGIAFELSGGPLPVNISAQVILRLGRRERPVGVVLARKGERLSFPLNGFVDGMGSSGVDVILRPDVTLAEETADVTEVWGEDIVFPGAEAER